MKTFVLATDFSESAAQVADYALALAGQFHARLVIVHAYEKNSDEPVEFVSVQVQLEHIRERLMRVSKGSVAISVVARRGEPRACIEAVVAQQQADLLIMALADDQPYTARFMGSLPTEMIPQTAVPMLILPPGTTYKPVKTVVLALDLSEPVDAATLGKANQFVMQLRASLAIICMNDEPDTQQKELAQRIQALFSGLVHTFRFLPGNDLTTTLDDYFATHPADRTRPDLIMMLPKHHNRLAIWLMESVTQQVARQAVVPVLAIV